VTDATPADQSPGDGPAADRENWRGKVGLMDRREMDEFLAGDALCRLAVLDERGWPYVVPVWYEWDPGEGVFWIIARQKSAWAGHMTRDPRVALTIDGDTRPYRKVAVQGIAELIEEPNVGGRWVEIARRMSVRYLGEHGPDYLVPTLGRPRWLFKIRPENLLTWQGVEWHKRYRTTGG
jgi:PPOX class probable F420-dependent enzyme